jgi:hypothetical protein
LQLRRRANTNFGQPQQRRIVDETGAELAMRQPHLGKRVGSGSMAFTFAGMTGASLRCASVRDILTNWCA